MTKYLNGSWWIIGLVLFIFSCQPKSEYHQLIEQELASGERHDSLFLGIYLGMSSKAFFDHCWQLNKQNILDQGGGVSVRYELKDELKAPATANFYPTFYQDTIREMPITFVYDAWAPWNEEFSADSLQLDVVKLMEKWHGGGFIEIKHPTGGVAHVKVDGNRRITVFKVPLRNKEVKAVFTDLTREDALKAMKPKQDDLSKK